MNQFSSIYGQLFCCNCPGGLSANRCNNRTGISFSYPTLVTSSYAWIAGLLSFLFLSILCLVGTIYCCRRHRRMQNSAISVIDFPESAPAADDSSSQIQALVPTAFCNTGFTEDMMNEEKDPEVIIPLSPNEEEETGINTFHNEGFIQETDSVETMVKQDNDPNECS